MDLPKRNNNGRLKWMDNMWTFLQFCDVQEQPLLQITLIECNYHDCFFKFRKMMVILYLMVLATVLRLCELFSPFLTALKIKIAKRFSIHAILTMVQHVCKYKQQKWRSLAFNSSTSYNTSTVHTADTYERVKQNKL